MLYMGNCEYVQTWRCPICGVPLSEGEKCEDGTLIESVPLNELPKYFHEFNWEMFSLHLLEVRPDFDEIENQRAIFMVIPPVEKQNKDAKMNILAPAKVDVETLDWAIYNLIEEYKYRRDCGLVNELQEKYEKIIKKWKNTQIRITANQRHYIHEAANAWGMDMRMVSSLFLAYVLNDEAFVPDTAWDADMESMEGVTLDVKELQDLSEEERKKKIREAFEKAERK